jgi:hypothetical protein
MVVFLMTASRVTTEYLAKRVFSDKAVTTCEILNVRTNNGLDGEAWQAGEHLIHNLYTVMFLWA